MNRLYQKDKDLSFVRRASDNKDFEEYPLIVQPLSVLALDPSNNLVCYPINSTVWSSASYSTTASFSNFSVASSLALNSKTASYIIAANIDGTVLSASFATTCSVALFTYYHVTQSFVSSSNQSLVATQSLYSTQSLFSTQSITSSYSFTALTASYAPSSLPDITDDTDLQFIGINQMNPNFTLDVNGIIGNSYSDLILSSYIGDIIITPNSVMDRNRLVIDQNCNISDVNSSYYIASDGNNSVINALGGNVGIGTNSPNFTLDVNGIIGNSSGDLNLASMNGNIVINPKKNTGTDIITIDQNANIFDENDNFCIGTNGGDTYFNGTGVGGFLGIGTNSPHYALDVTGDINFTGQLWNNGQPFTASYAKSASLASSCISSSYVSTSSWAQHIPTVVSTSYASSSISASYASYASSSISASYASLSISASYALTTSYSKTSSLASTASYSLTASNSANAYSINFVPIAAISASWISASVFIITAQTASYISASNVIGQVSSSHISDTASYSYTASFALNAGGGTNVVFSDVTSITQQWSPSQYGQVFFDYTKSLYTPTTSGMYRLNIVATGSISGSGNIYFGAKFIDEIGAYALLDTNPNNIIQGSIMAGPQSVFGSPHPYGKIRYYFSYIFSAIAGQTIEYYWTDNGNPLGDSVNPVTCSLTTKAAIEKLL